MKSARPILWALAGAAFAAGCTSNGDSVRILTFNTQFLPGSSDDTTRPQRIAERIKAADYDIVMFDEVFDETARELLVDELKGRFPNYIEYLGDDAVGSEDSGLMLFSRFPFEPLPLDTHKVESDDVDAINLGAFFYDVGFIEYDDDVFPDNWAAKGAAFVRIRNPNTDRILNVAFSHMQASYPEDEEDSEDWLEPIQARTGQFEDLRRVIEGSLTSGQRSREDVFVLGDLNVDGDLGDANLGSGGYDQPNLWEWVTRFATPGEFFTDYLKDAWAFEQLVEDRGLTNLYHWGAEYSPDQGARLDYFLRNRPSGNERLCVQHMTLAHNLRDGDPKFESGFGLAGPNELSDHIGINIDLNREAPFCNPKAANANPPVEFWINGVITFPGSVQWLRFDEPGTYAFAVQGAGMDYRVYSAHDMSTPVPQYYEETITFTPIRGKPTTGKKFHFPEPPYLVKVFNTSRTGTGAYQFVAHRATCNSQEDACVLRANETVATTLPGIPINADDTAWFEFHTERADSGAAQWLTLMVDDYAPSKLELYLTRDDGATVLAEDVIAEADFAHPGKLLLKAFHQEVGPSKLYLKVKRLDTVVTSFGSRWETDLTILHGQNVGVPGAASANLFCYVETDGVADIDEVWLTVKVDGATTVDDVYIGDYDDGSYRTMEDYLGKIAYLSEVEVILREDDGGLSGDDDYLTTTIGGLPADKTQKLNETSTLACCDGEYLLRYNRSRSLLK